MYKSRESGFYGATKARSMIRIFGAQDEDRTDNFGVVRGTGVYRIAGLRPSSRDAGSFVKKSTRRFPAAKTRVGSYALA